MPTIPRLPVLTTDRLVLRQMDHSSEADIDFLLSCFNDPAVVARVGDYGLRTPQQFFEFEKPMALSHYTLEKAYKASGRALPEEVANGKELLKLDGGLCWFFYEKKDSLTHTSLAHPDLRGHHVGEPIGMISLLEADPPIPHLGWCMLGAYHGKGYGTEAARAVKEYVMKDFGLKDIMVLTDPDNAGSYRVAEKIGFVKAPYPLVEHGREHVDMSKSEGMYKEASNDAQFEVQTYILPTMKPFPRGTPFDFLGGNPQRT